VNAQAPRRRRLVVVAAGTGTALGFLDQTIIGVALPTIGVDLGLSATERSWVVEAYLIPLAALAVIAGSIGARIGVRRLFTAGVLVFVAGSLACGLAAGPGWLIAGRAVQGTGAAAMFTAGQVMVVSAYPKARRGRAIGGFLAVTTIALSIGPLVGGALVDLVGWRAVFFVNPVLALATLPYILGWARNPEGDARSGHPPRFDASGFLLLVPILLLGAWGVTEAGRTGWSAATIAAVGAAALTVPVLIRVESRRRNPMLDVELLRQPVVGSAIVVVSAVGFVQLWGAISFPAFLQHDLGFSAFAAGAGLLPLTLALTGGQLIAGRIADLRGPALPGLVGTAGAGASLVATALLVPVLSYVSLVPVFVVAGISLALAQTPMDVAAMSSVGAERRTNVSGLLATARQSSALFGLAFLGSLGALLTRDDVTGGGGTGAPESGAALQVGCVGAAVVLFAAALLIYVVLVRRGEG
jgi:MFS transporter, DHA2 family, methylenomycin A resistance protein